MIKFFDWSSIAEFIIFGRYDWKLLEYKNYSSYALYNRPRYYILALNDKRFSAYEIKENPFEIIPIINEHWEIAFEKKEDLLLSIEIHNIKNETTETIFWDQWVIN